MARDFIIKICGITSLDDAEAAVAAGANALGFNFYPKSPRYLTPRQARAMTQALPADILRVGVFVNASKEELLDVSEQAGLDVLQLHGDAAARPEGHRVWRATDGEHAHDFEIDHTVEALLLDRATPEYGGSGKTFDWQTARGLKTRVIVAGGLDSSNVATAIAALQPWGVDVCSRIESAPGKKDHAKMRAFVAAAQAAASQLLVTK